MERGLDTGMISAFYRVEDTAPCRVLELAGFVAAAETADTQSSRDVLYPQVCARMQAHARAHAHAHEHACVYTCCTFPHYWYTFRHDLTSFRLV